MNATIHHGDCIDVLRGMPDNSVDAVVCDPPYGLSNTTPEKVTDTIVRWAQGDREYMPSDPRKGRKNCVSEIIRRHQIQSDDSDAGILKDLVNLNVTLDIVGLPAMFGAVDLDNDSTLGQVEVHDVSPELALDDVLVNSLFANFGKYSKHVQFGLRSSKVAASSCVGECACLAELAHSSLGVGVRLGYYSLADTEGAAPVVALTTTEVRAILSFDRRRGAFELSPASGAVEDYSVTLVAHAQLIRATAGASGLASVPEPGGIGGVDNAADGALALDLLTHNNLLDRFVNPKSTPVGFMNQAWDSFVPPPAVWDECLRVLKPGGHLAVFAGSRTVDLMGISLRLAGAGIRDSIMWVHGQGFPKGNSQLKPAREPILLARKPFKGSTKANLEKWGTGPLGIDACRVSVSADDDIHAKNPHTKGGFGHGNASIYGDSAGADAYDPAKGRWPANVVLDPDTAAALDQQSGPVGSNSGTPTKSDGTRNSGGMYSPGAAGTSQSWEKRGGGASRFFKVVEPDPPFMYAAKAPKRERPSYTTEDGQTVQHATVKPLSIMQWLVKLVTPEGGTVLDPFAGSGTTVEAAILEGFNVIGIEREAEYLPLIQQRIDRATPDAPEPTETDLLDLITGDAA